MIKHKGENIIASKLISFKERDKDNNTYRTLDDMIHCYDRLKQCDFDFAKRYDIDELHLQLATSVGKLETENRTIYYTNRELSLEMTDDTFSLLLANDTHELIDIGVKMGICVGSYADDVISNNCTILILRRIEDNKPVGCIELCSWDVVQAKGNYNKLLQNEELDFIEKWIDSKGLHVATDDLHVYQLRP